ncbi:MAG: hypothetical protein JO301_16025, partial [Chitinophagaceae bacterium]|nr:hypothetical protein [Chitinophagaceae bacterium]
GSVTYQGTSYENIPLLYDFAKDALITRDFTGELSMELLKEKISRFSLGQHEFVKIEPDSGSSMRPGFYELLYSGPASVLVKRTNQVVRVTQREDEPGKLSADRQFAEYDDYYVLKNGQYIPVRGEADLLNVLKDHRAELRKFLARRPKSYRKDPAAAIVAAVSYYEQLKN